MELGGVPVRSRSRSRSRLELPEEGAWATTGGSGERARVSPQRWREPLRGGSRMPPGYAEPGHYAPDGGPWAPAGPPQRALTTHGNPLFAASHGPATPPQFAGMAQGWSSRGAPSWDQQPGDVPWSLPPPPLQPPPLMQRHDSSPQYGMPRSAYADEGARYTPPGWRADNPQLTPWAGGRLPAPALAPAPRAAEWRAVQATLRAAEAAAAARAAAEAAEAAEAAASRGVLRALADEVLHFLRRVWYIIDSRLGELSVQVALLVVLAAVISIAGGRVVLFLRDWALGAGYQEGSNTYSDCVWYAWSLLVDPGFGVWPDRPHSLRERIGESVIIIIGILYLSLVVGLIVGAVQTKMASLKQGLAAVVEDNHTVVLGWAEQSLTIIRELCLANASEGGGVIVVLASNNKQQMEAELAGYLDDDEMLGTKVVFRTGSRLRSADLRFVAADAARAVVCISDVRLDPDTADAEILQVVLNLTTLDMQPHCSVVAEVRDIDNEPLVRMIGDALVHTVTSHDIIGKLMLLFLRTPGLSRVYGTLLGFEGSEVYVARWEALAGVRWRDVAPRFKDAVAIGLRDAGGAVILNPPADTAIRADDELIVLAEDNDTYTCEAPVDLGSRRAFRGVAPEPPRPEAVLFAGWRRDVAHMIALLDRLVEPGSELHMLCPVLVREREAQFHANGLAPGALRNLRLVHHVGNCASQRGLELVPLERITSAVVLSDHAAGAEVVYSDSHVLSSLLLMRGLQAGIVADAAAAAAGAPGAPGAAPSARIAVPPRPGVTTKAIGTWDAPGTGGIDLGVKVPMVAEILDPRTQRTVNESYKVHSVSEFIQSNELISKMLAMIAEEPAVKVILDALLGGGGGTLLALAPAEEVVGAHQEASFFEVARECTLTHNATLCGYLEAPPPAARGHRAQPRVLLNPPDKAARRSWLGNKLVMIRTDARLLSSRSAVEVQDLAW